MLSKQNIGLTSFLSILSSRLSFLSKHHWIEWIRCIILIGNALKPVDMN